MAILHIVLYQVLLCTYWNYSVMPPTLLYERRQQNCLPRCSQTSWSGQKWGLYWESSCLVSSWTQWETVPRLVYICLKVRRNYITRNTFFNPQLYNKIPIFYPQLHNKIPIFYPQLHNKILMFYPQLHNKIPFFYPQLHNKRLIFYPQLHNKKQFFTHNNITRKQFFTHNYITKKHILHRTVNFSKLFLWILRLISTEDFLLIHQVHMRTQSWSGMKTREKRSVVKSKEWKTGRYWLLYAGVNVCTININFKEILGYLLHDF